MARISLLAGLQPLSVCGERGSKSNSSRQARTKMTICVFDYRALQEVQRPCASGDRSGP